MNRAAGVLYLVPSPLGGLDCLEVLPGPVMARLSQLDYLIVEQAKSARAFLGAVHRLYPRQRPIQEVEMARLNVSTQPSELPALLAPLLAGRDAALISEAGAPAVADPGATLIALAHRHAIRVRPLVGPSAILLALMASGLEGQRFAFHGYLPVPAAERARALQAHEKASQTQQQTQIFIETPYRNAVLLEACLTHLRSQTMLCVATDLSLADESVRVRAISEWRSHPRPDLKDRPSIFLFLAHALA